VAAEKQSQCEPNPSVTFIRWMEFGRSSRKLGAGRNPIPQITLGVWKLGQKVNPTENQTVIYRNLEGYCLEIVRLLPPAS